MIQFDDYKQKINALKPALDGLKQAMKLDEGARELALLEGESARDGFWTDLENSQKVLQKIKQLKSKKEVYEKLDRTWSDLQTLCQMGTEEKDESLIPELEEELKAFDAELETARLEVLLTGEYDNSPAIISFHAGAGGT